MPFILDTEIFNVINYNYRRIIGKFVFFRLQNVFPLFFLLLQLGTRRNEGVA